MQMMVPVEHDELARASAITFVRSLAERWQQVLGSDLCGLYLIGSLAHMPVSAAATAIST